MSTATATRPPKEPPVFNLPNQLTALRFVLAIGLFVLIYRSEWLWSTVVFALAALTDWLDGYLARKQGLTSTLGRNFDPLVDKILICGAFIFLVPVAGAGVEPWMVVVVVTRELLVTSLRSFIENRGASFGAGWLGKLKMVLQCAALLAVLLHLSLGSVSWLTWLGPVRDWSIYAMVGATLLSGLHYLLRAALLLRHED